MPHYGNESYSDAGRRWLQPWAGACRGARPGASPGVRRRRQTGGAPRLLRPHSLPVTRVSSHEHRCKISQRLSIRWFESAEADAGAGEVEEGLMQLVAPLPTHLEAAELELPGDRPLGHRPRRQPRARRRRGGRGGRPHLGHPRRPRLHDRAGLLARPRHGPRDPRGVARRPCGRRPAGWSAGPARARRPAPADRRYRFAGRCAERVVSLSLDRPFSSVGRASPW